MTPKGFILRLNTQRRQDGEAEGEFRLVCQYDWGFTWATPDRYIYAAIQNEGGWHDYYLVRADSLESMAEEASCCLDDEDPVEQHEGQTSSCKTLSEFLEEQMDEMGMGGE